MAAPTNASANTTLVNLFQGLNRGPMFDQQGHLTRGWVLFFDAIARALTDLSSTTTVSPAPFSTGNWVRTLDAVDGHRNRFRFSALPVICAYNGLLQFEGVGYTVVPSGAQFAITLLDVNGDTITPEVDDQIWAQLPAGPTS